MITNRVNQPYGFKTPIIEATMNSFIFKLLTITNVWSCLLKDYDDSIFF